MKQKPFLENYDLSGYTPEEQITINHFRNEEDHSSKVVQAYLEKLLKIFPTRTLSVKGGVKAELTESERKAGFYIYNRFILFQAKQRLSRVEKWMEITESPDLLPDDHRVTNPRWADSDMDMNQHTNYFECLMRTFVYTVLFRGFGCDSYHNYVTTDNIILELEKLQYDEETVFESMSKNSGQLYAIMFDSQSVDSIRVCNDKRRER